MHLACKKICANCPQKFSSSAGRQPVGQPVNFISLGTAFRMEVMEVLMVVFTVRCHASAVYAIVVCLSVTS